MQHKAHKQNSILVSNESIEKKQKIAKEILEYQTLIKSHEKSLIDSLNKLAKTYESQREWHESISCYQKILDIQPDRTEIYIQQSKCFLQLASFHEAIKGYKKAIKLDPDLPFWVYRDLANALYDFKSADKQEAVSTYQKVIQLKEDQPFWVYMRLGDLLIDIKRKNEGIASYKKALSIESNNHTLYLKLGSIQLQSGKLDEAFNCYLEAVKIKPDVLSSYGKLGYFHGHTQLTSHQLNIAIKAYKSAIKVFPYFYKPYVYLGDSFAEKGDLSKAIHYYQIAGRNKFLEKYPKYKEKENENKFQQVDSPNFIIIGAGKCGTSSLYEYIFQHPNASPSIKKEIRFFNHQPNFQKGINWYRSHFSPILPGDNFISGEATPGYLYADIEKKVYDMFPNVKLIVLMRNPIDKAISHYNHWVRNGLEVRSFEESVTPEIKKLEMIFDEINNYNLDKFEDIKRICKLVQKGNKKGETCYLWQGLYFYFVKKWMNYFSKKQLMMIKSEDLFSTPESTLKKVFDFLNLPDYHLKKYKKYNTGNYNSKLSKNFSIKLASFFDVHNNRLEDQIDQRLNWF